MTEEIYGTAVFPCDPDTADRILTTSEDADAIIWQQGVKKPDGSVPKAAWTPAIFRPEAGLARFDVHDAGGGWDDAEDCRNYDPRFGLPEGLESALWLTVYGRKDHVLGFCRKLASLLGVNCHIGYNRGDIFKDERPPGTFEVLPPEGKPADDVLDLLYEKEPVW